MSTFVVGDLHGRRKQLGHLLSLLPREAGRDTLVFLGDLIDRGDDIPGTVSDVLELQSSSPEGSVVCLRGNHEQMLIDFLDDAAPLWLHPAVGSAHTFGQYTGYKLTDELRSWWEEAQRRVCDSLPPEHLAFFRALPLFHEDEHAFYVHAGPRRREASAGDRCAPPPLVAQPRLLQALLRQALRLRPHADAASAAARPPRPPRHLRLAQRHRHRHRLRPDLRAHLPAPPRVRPLPDLRRRPLRALPHDQLHPRALPQVPAQRPARLIYSPQHSTTEDIDT